MKRSYELLTVEDNCYLVHRNGKIESKNGYLAPCNNGNGYLNVSLGHGTRYYKFYIHRLVAEAFVPNPNNLPEVNHKNGNKLDNRKVNLEWNTKSENIIHAYSIGLKEPGEKNGNSILTEDIVRQIRKLHPTFSYYALGRRFNTWPNNIKQIVLRKTWKHIK